MINTRIEDEYFEWMFNLVCGKRYSSRISYRKLLRRLHDIDFRYSILKDGNRAEDGVDLRYRFTYIHGYEEPNKRWRNRPCSVLEMIVALAIRCEEGIMDDPLFGDRTSQWFWGMIVNLGLGSMTDDIFDKDRVDEVIERFLDREYAPDGKGGLFTIKNCEEDLRNVEIWIQMCWYLDTIM